MAWTDDDNDILRRLWGEGLTASQIAAEMPRKTRNAVLGQARRLDLAARGSPVAFGDRPTLPTPMVRRLFMRLQQLGLSPGSRESIIEALAFTQTGTPGQVARALGVSRFTVDTAIDWLERKYGWQAK